MLLAVAALCIGWAIYASLSFPDSRHRLSLASAYVSVIYLAISLALGPYRIWRKLPNPISFDLRRDIGIWVGLLAILHTLVGLTVHLRGRMWMYFLEHLHPVRVQKSLFGVANYLGAAAVLVFLLLVLISNNLSLRKLGTGRWKSIQRWGYVAAGLTVVHGFAYQFVEKRQAGWVAVLLVIVGLAAGLQVTGFLLVRRARNVPTGIP
jgi:methionine sulfoxide reductase heme-binding subunit